MDIGKGKSVAEREDEGVVIEVRDEMGEVEEGVTITVAGSYSSTYRKAERTATRSSRAKRGGDPSDVFEVVQVETAARCIRAWTGFTANGAEFPYSTENAVTLLTEAPWVREQVVAAMYDHAGFFPKPSASS